MTQITIPNVATEVEYSVTSASTGPFTVPFPFLDKDDVFGTVTDAAGVVTALVNITDFTFTSVDVPVGQEGNGFEGGEITLGSSIGADGDTTLKIYRSTTIDRTANYPNTGPFSVPLLNDEQNNNIAIMQELATEIAANTANVGDIPDGGVLTISDSAGTAFVEHYVTTDGDNYVLDFTNIGDLGSNGGILMQATGNQPNRIVLNDFGTMFFNSQRNAQSGLVLGETTTLRGDNQNSAVTLYAEDSGAITFGQLACRGERLWLNAQGMYLQFDGTGAAEFNVDSFKLSEVAAAPADEAAYGQIWVKDDTPNTLMFTDDAGTDGEVFVNVAGSDLVLTGGSDVEIRDNGILRVYEADDSTYVQIQHGITNTLISVSGAGVNHDLFITSFNNVNITSGANLWVKDGGYIQASDATDTDTVKLSESGTLAVLETNTNPLEIQAGGVTGAKFTTTNQDFYYSTDLRLRVAVDGQIDLYADTDTSTETNQLRFLQANGTLKGRVGYESPSAALVIRNYVHGAQVNLLGEDNAGVVKTMVLADPDGAVFTYYDGSISTQTVPDSSGGLNVHNLLTGTGAERALTVSDSHRTATTTELDDITDTINTSTEKDAGFMVFNTTTSKPVWANGSADNSIWTDATGATAHTPV